MGNICRSPSAEGYFRHHLARSPLAGEITTDSAGTHGYHVGHPADERAVAVMAKRGIDISDLRARRVVETDFERFDWILAMDEANLDILQQLQPDGAGNRATLELMMVHSSRFDQQHEVPDPYYGGMDGFEHMCDLLDEATQGLLARIAATRQS
jgi:protein-tyrosine phosphatase